MAAVGAGYAILIALAWRNRERAVTAIEERDGVRFYVEPTSALEPVKLVRTPGLGRDRCRLVIRRLRRPPPSDEAGRGRPRASVAPTARGASAAPPRRERGGAGVDASASQPAIGPPIGVEPRKTIE